jgi:outer membrane protein assembly factor BamB
MPAMRSPAFRLVLTILLPLTLGCSALHCGGYTYVQAGVDSNLLIDDARVLFIQADGSLTALSLKTGGVLVRARGRNYSGELRRVPGGILLMNDRTLSLLNPADFRTVWESPAHCEPNLQGDALVSCDEQGLVQCRNLDDGGLRWSYSLPGSLEIVAESEKVLVHRASTYERGVSPATALLDLDKGTELFRQSPTNGVHEGPAFFDGTNIFIETGSLDETNSDFEPERMAIWNLKGHETGSIPFPRELRDSAGSFFELDGKTFWKGHVYANRQSIPADLLPTLSSAGVLTNADWTTYEKSRDLGGGITFIERAAHEDRKEGGEGAFVMEVELRAPTNHWLGVIPYLLNRGRITAVTRTEQSILIGTDSGQVECIEAATGESRWLYVFPTLHRTTSISSRSRAPMLSEAAAIFRKENGAPPASGIHIIVGKAAAPRVILDPNPVDPYVNLPRQLAAAWIAAGIPVLILLLMHALPRTRRWGSNALGSIAAWLAFLLVCLYPFLGRVSPDSSMALRIAIAAGFACGFGNAAVSFARGQKTEGSVLAVTVAAMGLIVWLALR